MKVNMGWNTTDFTCANKAYVEDYLRGMINLSFNMASQWLASDEIMKQVEKAFADKKCSYLTYVARSIPVLQDVNVDNFSVGSRVIRMINENFMSSAIGYLERVKKAPGNKTLARAGKLVRFSVVDTIIATQEVVDDEIRFSLRTPRGVMTLVFSLPSRYRNSDKISRPMVYLNKNNDLVFMFTAIDNVKNVRVGKNKMGVDIGRFEPFIVSVLHASGRKRVYYASEELYRLRDKVNNNWVVYNNMVSKIEHFKNLGLNGKVSVLEREKGLVLARIARLNQAMAVMIGREVALIGKRHKVVVNVENLKWLRNSGGKWNHSEVMSQIEHYCRKNGVRVRRVSAENTSRECSSCGSCLTRFVERFIVCDDCGERINRDVNASINIARRVN